jgi:hypothetical protein
VTTKTYKNPSPVILLVKKRASLSQNSGGSVQYVLSGQSVLFMPPNQSKNCNENGATFNAFQNFCKTSTFLEVLKTELPNQFTFYILEATLQTCW